MRNNNIKSIIYAAPFDMGGLPVRQAFPSTKTEHVDPFLLLHHAEFEVPEHIPVSQSGVGPHPHRGFSPVTFILKGGVHHRDSRGNDNTIYEGGVQWMNAGMGIIHSERPPADIFEKGGMQEIIQLWVNSPAHHKMDQPVYQSLTAEETPVVTTADGLVRVMIHSGELNELKSPLKTLSPVNTYTLHMKKGGKFTIPITPGFNAFLYIPEGKIMVNGTAEVDEKFVVIFKNDGEGIGIEAKEDSRITVGSGKPLEEPVVSHGPFVMNNQTQIMEAFKDYQMGKMGVLIED